MSSRSVRRRAASTLVTGSCSTRGCRAGRAGALGTCTTAILRALHPDVEVLVVARFGAQADLARKLGATVIAHEPTLHVIEEAAAWSGGVLQPADGLPMAYPGAIDVVYDT